MVDAIPLPLISSASSYGVSATSRMQTFVSAASQVVETVITTILPSPVSVSESITRSRNQGVWEGFSIQINGGGIVVDLVSSLTMEVSGPLGLTHTLARPITVELFQEQGEFVADSPELSIYAFGRTPLEAINALRERIRAEYRFYLNPGVQLAPDALSLAQRYREVVRPIRRD